LSQGAVIAPLLTGEDVVVAAVLPRETHYVAVAFLAVFPALDSSLALPAAHRLDGRLVKARGGRGWLQNGVQLRIGPQRDQGTLLFKVLATVAAIVTRVVTPAGGVLGQGLKAARALACTFCWWWGVNRDGSPRAVGGTPPSSRRIGHGDLLAGPNSVLVVAVVCLAIPPVGASAGGRDGYAVLPSWITAVAGL
jgi:hypothetical protein